MSNSDRMGSESIGGQSIWILAGAISPRPLGRQKSQPIIGGV